MGDTEGRVGGQRASDAVRHEPPLPRRPGGLPLVLQPRDRVRACMREVDAGAAEADPGSGRGKHHPGPRLEVRAVGDRPLEKPADESIAWLTHNPRAAGSPGSSAVRRASGGGSARIRDRGVGLRSVEQRIDPGRRRHSSRNPEGQIGVAESDERTQQRMCDTGLDLLVGRSSTATAVTSDPVPAVVGTARATAAAPVVGAHRRAERSRSRVRSRRGHRRARRPWPCRAPTRRRDRSPRPRRPHGPRHLRAPASTPSARRPGSRA